MTIQSIPYKSAIVTLHDAAPSFSKRIFEFTGALENLGISFNIGVIPFYRHKEDLPRFPEFVDKIKSLNNAEIVLHGLYHEDRNGIWDDFFHNTKGASEEEIRAALEIFQEVGIKSNVFVPPRWKLGISWTAVTVSVLKLESITIIINASSINIVLIYQQKYRLTMISQQTFEMCRHFNINIILKL